MIAKHSAPPSQWEKCAIAHVDTTVYFSDTHIVYAELSLSFKKGGDINLSHVCLYPDSRLSTPTREMSRITPHSSSTYTS